MAVREAICATRRTKTKWIGVTRMWLNCKVKPRHNSALPNNTINGAIKELKYKGDDDDEGTMSKRE